MYNKKRDLWEQGQETVDESAELENPREKTKCTAIG